MWRLGRCCNSPAPSTPAITKRASAAAIIILRAIHTFAPETERTCFYFYSFIDGFRGAGATTNTVMAEPAVLREDATLLEQQQLRLEGYDMERMVAIPSDVARIHMGRFLARKIAEEQEERKVPAD